MPHDRRASAASPLAAPAIAMTTKSLLLILALASALTAQGGPDGKRPEAGAGSGDDWFAVRNKVIEIDGAERHVFAEFAFANPRDHDVVWRDFTASCACSHLEFRIGDRHYWMKPKPREFVQLVAAGDGEAPRRIPVDSITIHPQESGTVEIHVDVHGKDLKKTIQVDIHSTDERAPMTRLQYDLAGVAAIVVTPPHIDLGLVSPMETREFEFEVHAAAQKDFDIHRPEVLPPGITVELNKVLSNDVAVWRVRGTYGPVKTGQGGLLKFATNLASQTSFTVSVTATVAQPIAITPGFLSLGLIRMREGKTAEIRFHANDGADLQAVRVSLEELSPAAKNVAYKARKDGKDLVVEIVVPADQPAGLVRGDLVVELDHAAKTQRVLFSGYVRP